MIFITSNSAKFSQAQRRLSQADISLTQFYMDLPELQASSAEAIAREKALVASTRINEPFFVEDSSFHIPALSGFPGVYVKYAVTTLGCGGILKLMSDIEDRRCYFVSHIAYFDENKKLHSFCFKREGLLIARDIADKSIGWSEIWKIIKIEKYNKFYHDLTKQEKYEQDKEWDSDDCFCRLTQYLKLVSTKSMSLSVSTSLTSAADA